MTASAVVPVAAILFDLDGALVESYRLSETLGDLPHDGVPEMLAGLAAAGYPLGIVTGRGRRLWGALEVRFAPGLFDVVITEGDDERGEPHTELLLAAAKAFALDPVRVAYVGGSRSALEAGRAAGMRVGVALWPHADADERAAFLAAIEAPFSEWTFERPADVTRCFASWC